MNRKLCKSRWAPTPNPSPCWGRGEILESCPPPPAGGGVRGGSPSSFAEISNRGKWIVLTAALLLFASCNPGVDSSFSPQIVIQGFLYANEPIDSIVIRQTIPITAVNEDDRLSGANVSISTGDTTYQLVEDLSSEFHGRYAPTQRVIAQPGKTYSIRVAALGQVATAQTTVPLAIHLDSVKLDGRKLSLTDTDKVIYPTNVDSLQTPGIFQYWSPSPGCAGYGLEAVCIAPIESNRIVDQVTESLSDSNSLGRYRFFILSTSEQIVWIQFTYYGINVIRALALDQNYEDYILGLYLSGSQFNNSTLHVSGGLGVFGSAARTVKYVDIE